MKREIECDTCGVLSCGISKYKYPCPFYWNIKPLKRKNIMPKDKLKEKIIKEFEERFKEYGFTKSDAAYCEDAASRGQGCWKLKHIQTFLSDTLDQVREETKQEIMIEENIVFYAFRYCLGRKTYVVSEMVDYLLNNWGRISEKVRDKIKVEIFNAIDLGEAGMDCDIREWAKIIEL